MPITNRAGPRLGIVERAIMLEQMKMAGAATVGVA